MPWSPASSIRCLRLVNTPSLGHPLPPGGHARRDRHCHNELLVCSQTGQGRFQLAPDAKARDGPGLSAGKLAGSSVLTTVRSQIAACLPPPSEQAAGVTLSKCQRPTALSLCSLTRLAVTGERSHPTSTRQPRVCVLGLSLTLLVVSNLWVSSLLFDPSCCRAANIRWKSYEVQHASKCKSRAHSARLHGA